MYVESIRQWAQWYAARHTRTRRTVRIVLIDDLCREFILYQQARGRDRHYRGHLKRFWSAFVNVEANRIQAAHIEALKTDMLRAEYHPKTINHDIGAIKALFRWAERTGLIPANSVHLATGEPVPPPDRKAWTVQQVRAHVRRADARLRPWLRCQYLTLMRPSEMCRVANGEGRWEEPWLYRLDVDKVSWRTGEPRRVVFSPLALTVFRSVKPHWSHPSSYYHACAESGIVGGPHPLRHSTATHLARLGATREAIDLLLGHLPPRVSRTYNQIAWQPLRATAGLLQI